MIDRFSSALADLPVPTPRRIIYFVSDSTGITAETLGNALLVNFPSVDFIRHTIPFVDTVDGAEQLVLDIDNSWSTGPAPIVFATVRSMPVRAVLARSKGVIIDLLGGHLTELETALGTTASEQLAHYHGVGDMERYQARMRAVEYATEHDDGQSVRAIDQADVIIVAPSQGGKTPTTMYLALQYGLLVGNYPLTDDDLPIAGLPGPIERHIDRCFGLTTTPLRLSQVRFERRPNSQYASLNQCRRELRRAEELFRYGRIPYLNSSTKSVEEMSAVIMQSLKLRD